MLKETQVPIKITALFVIFILLPHFVCFVIVMHVFVPSKK